MTAKSPANLAQLQMLFQFCRLSSEPSVAQLNHQVNYICSLSSISPLSLSPWRMKSTVMPLFAHLFEEHDARNLQVAKPNFMQSGGKGTYLGSGAGREN